MIVTAVWKTHVHWTDNAKHKALYTKPLWKDKTTIQMKHILDPWKTRSRQDSMATNTPQTNQNNKNATTMGQYIWKLKDNGTSHSLIVIFA